MNTSKILSLFYMDKHNLTIEEYISEYGQADYEHDIELVNYVLRGQGSEDSIRKLRTDTEN